MATPQSHLLASRTFNSLATERPTRAGAWAMATSRPTPGAPGVADTKRALLGCPCPRGALGSHLPFSLVVVPHRDPSVLLRGTSHEPSDLTQLEGSPVLLLPRAFPPPQDPNNSHGMRHWKEKTDVFGSGGVQTAPGGEGSEHLASPCALPQPADILLPFLAHSACWLPEAVGASDGSQRSLL